MTLVFTREVLIVKGFPIIGTVFVKTDGRRYFDGWEMDLEVLAFEPESPLGLTWGALKGPCDDWMASNRGRVEKKVLRGPEPRVKRFKRW